MLLVKIGFFVLLAQVYGMPTVPFLNDSDESLETNKHLIEGRKGATEAMKCNYICKFQRKAVDIPNPHPGFFAKMVESLKEDVKEVGSILGTAAKNTEGYFQDVYTNDKTKLESIYQGALANTEAILSDVNPVVKNVERFVTSVTQDANAEIGTIARNAKSLAKEISADVSNFANTAVKSTADLGTSIQNAVTTVEDFATSAAEDANTEVGILVKKASSLYNDATQKIADSAKTLVNSTVDIATSIKNSIDKDIDEVEETIDNLEVQSGNWITNAWQSVTAFFDKMQMTVKELIHMFSMASLVIIGLTLVVLLVKALYYVKKFFHVTEKDLMACNTASENK